VIGAVDFNTADGDGDDVVYAGPGIPASATEIDLPLGASTISSLHIKSSVASSGSFTVMKNGAATVLTCTLNNTTTCGDLTDTVLFNDGDTIAFRFVPTSASNARIALSVRTS
jgi:hypothetical protein